MKTKLSHTLSLLTLLAAGALAFAQTQIIPAGGGTSTAIHPDSIQDGNIYGYYMDTDAQTRAGGNLLGKVAIAGNPLTWDPIPVNVTCAGKVAFTTYANGKGGFRISVVNANGALSTENDAKRQMETHFEGCSVKASLAGYTSSSIVLEAHHFRDDPEIGTITLTRPDNTKGSALSSTSDGIAPRAVKLFEKARNDWEAQSPDHVKADLIEAVSIDPKFAEAWYQLGRQEQTSNPQQAREDYAKAMAADPLFIRPYEQLMVLDSQDDKWKDVLGDAGHALQLDPHGSPQIWYAYAAGILKEYSAGALPLAKLKIGETSARNSLALDPQHTVQGTEQILALILAEEKNYAAAIDHLRNYLTYAPAGASADVVKQQIAQLEQLQAGTAK